MKSSCTGTRLNWRRNSKKQDGSVDGLMFSVVVVVVVVVVFVSNWGNAQCVLVRWKRGSSQRRALWSAENEALPQSKALWSAESEAKNHGKISNFSTFLLYLDYELLLRSLRSLRSNKESDNFLTHSAEFSNQTLFSKRVKVTSAVYGSLIKHAK